ncbi:ECF-type sigma factor, partial [Acinetobacter baumannii]
RFFGGFGHAEIGAALGVALRTVERDWEQARSYLFHRLQNADPA